MAAKIPKKILFPAKKNAQALNLDAFEKGWGMSLPRLGHRLKIQHLTKRNPVRLDDVLAVAQVHLALCLFYENVVDG